jgi:Tol biopolymer transport system component
LWRTPRSWSPDSQSLAFFADGKLKVLDVAGRAVRTLTNDIAEGNGGSWNRDGVILYAANGVSSIRRVPASGGESGLATQLQPQQRSNTYPQFLPDGRHFLYYVAGVPDVRGVYVGQLDSSDTHRLIDADAGLYAGSGYLLFVRQGTLFAQPFNPDRLELTGVPIAVAEQVAFSGGRRGVAALSAASSGTIAYRTGVAIIQRQFAWFDRSGTELEKVGDPGPYGAPSISPDFRRLAFPREINGNTDIWLLEVGRGIVSRFHVRSSA